ncbi:MAG: hypothetical protein ACI8XB_002385 [Patiriisocius sp.]|jgi:hypothetical protein
MKVSNKLFFLPASLLLIAYFFRLGTIPNQLLLIGGAFILILICLFIFLLKQIKNAESLGQKFIHFVHFIIAILVIILPFAGVFNQGLIPISIYIVLLLVLMRYFIKLNDARYTLLNFIQPSNYRNFVLLNLILIILNSPFQFVIPDVFYSPDFQSEYEYEKGPNIYIDEAHNNHHKGSGLYTTFSNILRKDGYNIKAFHNEFSVESLDDVDILVISNALNNKNVDNWERPVYSAFSETEIQNLNIWVKAGGSLFFIADHMPFGTASKDLALSFGFKFSDGSVVKKVKDGIDLFSRKKKTLSNNIITQGRGPTEFIDSVVTFTGQAIEIPESAISILVFNDEYVHYTPQIRHHIDDVEEENITGLSQGAYMTYGTGRIVVFGEAAMFTGQLPAGLSFWKKIGLNSVEAKNNYKLLLNIVHWLDHKID